MTHTINATGKSLGRTASQAAIFLMGKDSPAYERNKVLENKVQITNASKTKIDTRKLKTTIYTRYSGYPGGLKKETMEEVITKKGYSELYRRAVYGMLPSNKLRKIMMKNLTISE